ncbi:MAG TPA: carbon-nitrogen hydrolase family protein [Bacteroidales bacterium]|nr:carbon-nitrogen hydrolase family protein [Bacteroidales bacterium]
MKTFTLRSVLFIFTFISVIITHSENLTGQSSNAKDPILIAGLQMTVTADIEKNRTQIIEGISKASRDGAVFLVTPEGSLSGYTNMFDQEEVERALKEVLDAAARNKLGLMLGTCFKENISGAEYCYNQVRLYSPEGKFMGAYSKVLRCSNLDLPGSGEMVDYVEGELKIFDWNGDRFGILICNDLWATPGYTTMSNPYLPWKLKQMGAQFIVHCINSGTNQRYRSFHESSAELWAISLKIPIMEINAAHGNDMINAQSGLIEPNGERSIRVKDSGNEYFIVKVYPSEIKVVADH